MAKAFSDSHASSDGVITRQNRQKRANLAGYLGGS
jgi:hypothetical protein